MFKITIKNLSLKFSDFGTNYPIFCRLLINIIFSYPLCLGNFVQSDKPKSEFLTNAWYFRFIHQLSWVTMSDNLHKSL